jgi:hypothetical protein
LFSAPDAVAASDASDSGLKLSLAGRERPSKRHRFHDTSIKSFVRRALQLASAFIANANNDINSDINNDNNGDDNGYDNDGIVDHAVHIDRNADMDKAQLVTCHAVIFAQYTRRAAHNAPSRLSARRRFDTHAWRQHAAIQHHRPARPR